MRTTLGATRLDERVLDGTKILKRLVEMQGTKVETSPVGSKEIKFENPGLTFLYFYNRGTSKILTIRTNDEVVGGRELKLSTPNVGASGETFVGQFDRDRYNDDKKLVTITIDSTTYVEVALLKI